MDKELRGVCDDLERATLQARDATRTLSRRLKKIGPTPVIDGKDVPGTVVFTDDPAKSDA